ncbi:Alpha/beta knot methyltransferase, partial [Pelagophyceae sp. CCMP2097]
LIVCASLIDKATNLGGLARTCEVFGAESLVVGSMRLTRTRDFEVVAASSERWIDIDEVPPAKLSKWLRLKKLQGYSIVALEQATESVSLADASLTLPVPSVLLLGSEREGIPVDLLDQVDRCLEIPQLGKVRSLNVHVSAAL